MISPQDIVVSLKMAETLNEFGWPQDKSCFWYCGIYSNTPWLIYIPKGINEIGTYSKMRREGEMIAAPTAEEVLRRLPRTIEPEGRTLYLTCEFPADPISWGGSAYVGYSYQSRVPSIDGCFPRSYADTVANAAAEVYVFLSQNNLLPHP